jgi:hypothetical protein
VDSSVALQVLNEAHDALLRARAHLRYHHVYCVCAPQVSCMCAPQVASYECMCAIQVSSCLRVCVYVCMYVCVYVCMCVCVHLMYSIA